MTAQAEQIRGRVLLLEPNAALRSAVITILAAERYEVERVDTLEHVLNEARGTENNVALVAWQSMQGLLADGRRSDLADLSQSLRLVLMVPRRWWRLLQDTHVPKVVTALIAKPFQADELISTLDRAFGIEPGADAATD